MSGLRLWRRPTLRVEALVLAVLVYLLAVVNGPWWSTVLAGRPALSPSTWLFSALVLLALVALHFIVVAAIANRWTVKPLLAMLVLASAISVHYMRAYAVVLDPTMIQNALHTDTQEARDLLSFTMLASIMAYSALPLLLLARVRVRFQPWKRASGTRLGAILAAVSIAGLSLLAIGRDLTPLMRTQPTARYLITPGNLINGLAVNALGGARDAAGPRRVIGLDAHLKRRTDADTESRPRPRVLVYVLGETARAASFSLLGYSRETNPALAVRDVFAFGKVRACGTSTEVSVPCLFSVYGREHYDERAIRQSDGLLHVLVRAGIDVKWRDNQSGCKGVCTGPGIEYLKLDRDFAPELCAGEDCLDGILVRKLRQDLDQVQRDTVIVLHMMGNHGPAYFKRYPPAFRRFVPDCQTAELRQCSREEIVNAYDNGILYTDHVLGEIIDELQRRAGNLESAMIYVSDHGESLGEGGLYLHGMPFPIAPGVQTQVPLVTWASSRWRASRRLDTACLKTATESALSHDFLFHTVLGALEVETKLYRPERDFLRPCGPTVPVVTHP